MRMDATKKVTTWELESTSSHLLSYLNGGSC